MTMNNSSIYSFKRILEEYLIYVPSFQRNYIQGSDEFKDKRDRLLDDIFESLKSRKVIDLGFVYGRSEESYKGRLFYPYDGQQRLTTLYFLYLMLYFRNIRNGEKESIKGLKGKLSYQTRQSTDRFINSFIDWICDSMEYEYDSFWNPNNKSSAFIKIQDCFFDYDWEYDVSIKNILSLIDTLKIRILKLEKEIAINEIINLIDDKEDDNPFKFIFIHIDDFIQNDELYIKINARGKALSHFENLKSDINNFWRNEDYKSKLDGAWTEYVWKESSKDSDSGTIEERFDSNFYNSFKNIFYLNYLSNIDLSNIEKPLNPAFINEIKNEWDNVFNKGKINKDWENKASCDVISYFFDAVSHPNYLFEKQADGYSNLLFKENPGYVECLKIYVYYYLISNIYKSRNCVTDLEIVLFDEIITLFKRLIDNQDKYLDSIDSLIKAIISSKYLIDKSIESNGILNFLQSNEVDISKLLGLRKEQVEEEILKARLIYKDKRFIDLFEKGYNELRNKGQLGFVFYLITNNNELRNIRTEDISYESFEKTLNQIISIQSFISNKRVIFNPNYELLLRAILAKTKDHFFWEKSNNLMSFPLLNDDRDMSLHTFLNCYSSNNPKDVQYKLNLLDGLREVLNSFDSNKYNIEEVLKRIIEDYKIKNLEDSKKEDSKAWYKFFVIYDGVFEQCRNGNIYFYSDKYVLLLDKKFRSGQWYEYYTFALKKALDEASKGLNITTSLHSTNGREREESYLDFKVNGIEYKCSMMNDKDRFIIKKNEKDNSDASFDTWNEWKEESLKILKREE